MCRDWSVTYKRWHLNILGKTTKTSFLKIHFQFSASIHFPVASNVSLISALPTASLSSLRVTVIATFLSLTGDYCLCVTPCLCYDRCLTLPLDEQPPFPSLSYRRTQGALLRRPGFLPGAPVQTSKPARAGTGLLDLSPKEQRRREPSRLQVCAGKADPGENRLSKTALHHS